MVSKPKIQYGYGQLDASVKSRNHDFADNIRMLPSLDEQDVNVILDSTSKAESTAESGEESEANSEAASKPDSKPDSKPESKRSIITRSKPKPKPKPKPEPEPKPKPKPKSEPTSEEIERKELREEARYGLMSLRIRIAGIVNHGRGLSIIYHLKKKEPMICPKSPVRLYASKGIFPKNSAL